MNESVMTITNNSGEYYHLDLGYKIFPDVALELEHFIYKGNKVLQQQIDNLYSSGKILVYNSPSGFPLSAEKSDKEIPETTFDVSDQDFIISKNEALAALSVDTLDDEVSYSGSMELRSTSGGKVRIDADNMFDLGDSTPLLDPQTATPEDIADILISLGLAK